jgi:hypothetical protein
MEKVVLNEDQHRFELPTESGTAILEFTELPGGVLDLRHTLVPRADRRRGAGRALVREALEHARARRLKIIPTCPYVAAWIERHPEDRELVVEGWSPR